MHNLAPLEGRGIGHPWWPFLRRTPKRSFGYGPSEARPPGEGAFPQGRSQWAENYACRIPINVEVPSQVMKAALSSPAPPHPAESGEDRALISSARSKRSPHERSNMRVHRQRWNPVFAHPGDACSHGRDAGRLDSAWNGAICVPDEPTAKTVLDGAHAAIRCGHSRLGVGISGDIDVVGRCARHSWSWPRVRSPRNARTAVLRRSAPRQRCLYQGCVG
jgi:hypothetical protein